MLTECVILAVLSLAYAQNFPLESSVSLYKKSVFAHLNADNLTFRFSRFAYPAHSLRIKRVDFSLTHLSEFDRAFKTIPEKVVNLSQTVSHSHTRENVFRVKDMTFARMLLSIFPLYQNYTLGRVRFHVMIIREDTRLDLEPFNYTNKTRSGGIVVIIEVLNWLWCAPCYNNSRQNYVSAGQTLQYGNGLILDFLITGYLKQATKMTAKIQTVDFFVAKFTFPNKVVFNISFYST